MNPRLYLALIHHPVVNKKKEIIASAVTNLDLHDISRAAKTFGVQGFYVVTPLADQQEICRRILRHWIEGWGARFNPDRGEALGLIRITASLSAARQEIERIEGRAPRTVATGAQVSPQGESKRLRFGDLRRMMAESRPWLLMFGTAWGLADPVLSEADHVLEPIWGIGDYNHLPVRSAAAIILDRLRGRRDL